MAKRRLQVSTSLLRFAYYSATISYSGAVPSAEKRRWGHRRYSQGRHYNLQFSIMRVVIFSALLTCALSGASAQDAPPAPPSMIDPKAQAVINRSIEALGGQAFLRWKSLTTTGRVYAIEDGRTSGLAPFKSTIEPPDKRRFSYGKGQPVILINNGDQAWEIDRFGLIHQPVEQVRRWKIGNRYSLENLLRLRLHEPGILVQDGGVDFVENRPVQMVEIIDSKQVQIKLGLNRNTYLPVQISYRVQNPGTHEWDQYAVTYSDYQIIQGIQTPLHITLYLNGDRVAETFRNTAQYDAPHPPDFFEPHR